MARRATDVRLETTRPMLDRSLRRPQHTFRIRVRPWQIVPCVVAPVLPGDTIKMATMNMRVLSKPLKDALSGWWLEMFLFYVRLGDLTETEQGEWKAMLLSGAALPQKAGYVPYYQGGNKFGWVERTYEHVVEKYFRNEDVWDPDANIIGDYYCAKISGPGSWWDSVTTDDLATDPSITGDPLTWETRWLAYQNIRNAKLTTATYQEYLAMQGVEVPQQLLEDAANRRAELVHFTRDWQFPVQSVDPATGVPSALVQWSLADRIKRGRFCAEPGLVLGVVVCRPKAYLKNQRGNAMDFLMDRPEAWMPSALDTEPHARMRYYAANTVGGGATDGPIWLSSEEYWIDPADYLQKGDQFTNFDFGSTVSGALDGITLVDLPKVTGGRVNPAFPNAADADAVFSGSSKWLDIDGVVNFGIASRGGRADASGRRAGGW